MAGTTTQAQQLFQAINAEVAVLKDQMTTVRGETAILAEMNTRLALIEHRLLELERIDSRLRADEGNIAGLQSSVSSLSKWRDDQEKQKAEWLRRLWAFGPNLVAAIISGITVTPSPAATILAMVTS